MENFKPLPSLKPPLQRISAVDWLKCNIFHTPANIVFSVIASTLVLYGLFFLLKWSVWDADFLGTTKQDCDSGGACWVFVKVYFKQFIYGLYPADSYWRINLAFGLLILICTVFYYLPVKKRHWLLIIPITLPIMFWLFHGDGYYLSIIETSNWGGLFLTVVITVTAIVIGFPLGILLALGRQSNMPAVHAVCVVFIEVIRGVPLITVLFMASVMLPLFLPMEMQVDKLLRAIIGISIFASAYIAEAVRAGLNSLPTGQYEAAKALGLSYWHKQIFVILPQALTIEIPVLLGSLISLFKDTTLVTIIGLADFLTMGYMASQNPAWLGSSIEVYVFCAFVYWVICFAASSYVGRLEARLASKQH